MRQYDGKELPPLGLTIRNQHGHEIMELSGQRYLFGKARLADLDWSVYYLMPYNSIEEQLDWLLVIMVVLLVALVLFILLLRERREKLRSRREVEEAARIRTANKLLEDEIEERRRTERELRETESELVQATKLAALGQMSASVAHEINQPLAAIQVNVASARLLLQQQRSLELEDVLGHVETLVARMSIIVRELKSFARRSDGRIEPFDLRQCVENALMLLDASIRHAEVSVQQAIPDGLVEVLGDQLRIEQVLINLFRNAIDAMDEADQRVLSIHVSVYASSVGLQVDDTGEGVPACPKQVFEPFFTTKSSGEGLGLGLSIAERIVHGVGGTLVAENRPDGGARFTPTLQRPNNE